MSYLIWSIGALFTVGLIADQIKDMPWYTRIGIVLASFVAWPFLFGVWVGTGE